MSTLEETEPSRRLLPLLMLNQVQSLADLYRAGCWTDDPDRMDLNKARHSAQREEAILEAQLWAGSATDILLEKINEMTGGTLDRPRILALAKEHSLNPSKQLISVKGS